MSSGVLISEVTYAVDCSYGLLYDMHENAPSRPDWTGCVQFIAAPYSYTALIAETHMSHLSPIAYGYCIPTRLWRGPALGGVNLRKCYDFSQIRCFARTDADALRSVHREPTGSTYGPIAWPRAGFREF